MESCSEAEPKQTVISENRAEASVIALEASEPFFGRGSQKSSWIVRGTEVP